MAQQPYTIIVQGTISNCYAGQTVNVQTVQNTQPAYDLDVNVDSASCTWTAVLAVASNPAFFTATTLCNGMMVTASGQAGFNFIQDSMVVAITLDCGGNTTDCVGVPGGSALPGTPCDDNNPATTGETWNSACQCVGDTMGGSCQAAFSFEQTQPWTISTENTSTGTAPFTYTWWLPDGSSSADAEPDFTFGSEGVYGICLTIADANGCSSWFCDTLVVDSNGAVSNTNNYWFDCLGVLYGNALPGTPCTDFLGNLGIFDANCGCQTNNTTDCLGNPGGGALPGTACTYTPDNGNTWMTGTWSADCVCGPDSNVFIYDCLGIPNGPNLPGTPCQPFGMTGTWNSACACVQNNEPCHADFWVLQAYGQDSLPVPYELWVWNLSSGNVVYSWDFGDGTTSTEAFPTHTYNGNGPYNLCLTVMDNNGCADTHCDTISINGDGIFEGMPVHAEDRQDGFTINVQDHLSMGVREQLAGSGLVAWPNPATDVLNIALDGALGGDATVAIIDVDGRVVHSERRQLGHGRNQFSLPTDELRPGLYSVRLMQGTSSSTIRFVKAD